MVLYTDYDIGAFNALLALGIASFFSDLNVSLFYSLGALFIFPVMNLFVERLFRGGF